MHVYKYENKTFKINKNLFNFFLLTKKIEVPFGSIKLELAKTFMLILRLNKDLIKNVPETTWNAILLWNFEF